MCHSVQYISAMLRLSLLQAQKPKVTSQNPEILPHVAYNGAGRRKGAENV